MSVRLSLTQRAARDIQRILDFSTERWGKRVAEKYLKELESGLLRIQSHPELLKDHPNFNTCLKFYRVNKHLIVCDLQPTSAVVLTIFHVSADIPHRLAELQPMLALEVQLLHTQLHDKKRRKP